MQLPPCSRRVNCLPQRFLGSGSCTLLRAAQLVMRRQRRGPASCTLELMLSLSERPCHQLLQYTWLPGPAGEPKAIPWSHVAPIRCAIDAWAHQDVRRGDVVAWPTNLGGLAAPKSTASALGPVFLALRLSRNLGLDFPNGRVVAALPLVHAWPLS